MKNTENYFNILELTGLFSGIKTQEIQIMLNCLGAVTQNIHKGKILLLAGDNLEYIGIVLSGQLHIIRDNYNGKSSLMASISTGEIFAEALCCAGVNQSPFTVIAAENSIIMKLNFKRVLKICSTSCSFHIKLMENMVNIVAKKNLLLQNRMKILETKTIREKVMLYLESFGERSVTLPFNREQMADFLCVERSALSHELIKMKRDGLIDYNKNRFSVF